MGREYIIQGRVQGVGFRFFTAQWMKKQRITGYVWNRDDGGVGVKAFAEEKQLIEFEKWLDAGGPKSAEITFWSMTICEYESMADFSIRH